MVRAAPLQHRVFCLGYSIKCDARDARPRTSTRKTSSFFHASCIHQLVSLMTALCREPSFPAALDVRAAKSLGVPKVRTSSPPKVLPVGARA